MKNLYLFILYYVIICFVGSLLTHLDKKRAIHGGQRIRESTLMLLAFLGAALPMYIVMKKIRHKTKHKKFMIGIPIFILMHLCFITAYVINFLFNTN